MRKTKAGAKDKKPSALKFKAEKKKSVEVEIDDRLAACARGDLQQIIYIGEMVERVITGEFGATLRALLRGRLSSALQESRQHGGTLNADRYLGRLDAYDTIMNDLEQYVTDKDAANKKLYESQRQSSPEQHLAEEPDPYGETVGVELG